MVLALARACLHTINSSQSTPLSRTLQILNLRQEWPHAVYVCMYVCMYVCNCKTVSVCILYMYERKLNSYPAPVAGVRTNEPLLRITSSPCDMDHVPTGHSEIGTTSVLRDNFHIYPNLPSSCRFGHSLLAPSPSPEREAVLDAGVLKFCTHHAIEEFGIYRSSFRNSWDTGSITQMSCSRAFHVRRTVKVVQQPVYYMAEP